MQLSELSERSGLPIPTIKFYLREGLLPAGDDHTGGRSGYRDEHLHRLRLIRAMVQIGDLSLSTISDILEAIDDPSISTHEALGVAHHALARRGATNAGSAELAGARAEVDSFLEDLGWRISDDAPDRDELAGALVTLRTLGWETGTEVFRRYAKAADSIAKWELSRSPDGVDRAVSVEAAIVGTVVFGSVLIALRRLAEEHHSALRSDG